MFRTTNIIYFALFFLLSSTLSHTGHCWCFFYYEAHVSFLNDLPQDSTNPLVVHCKSKDDDLGIQTLGYGETWGFKFCVNPFSTLFRCDLNWGDQYITSIRAFDGRWMIIFYNPCAGYYGTECPWSVNSTGARLPRGIIYPWKTTESLRSWVD